MSIENEIKKLTAAIVELTNAVATPSEKGTTPAPVKEPAQASPVATAPTPEPEQAETDVFGDDGKGEPAVEAAAEVESYDKKQIIAAIIALAKARGREVASSMMAEFGHKKASEFNDAAQYPAVMAKIAELTAA